MNIMMAAYPAIRFTPRYLSGACGVSLLSGPTGPDIYRQRPLSGKKIFLADHAEIAESCEKNISTTLMKRNGIEDAIFCEITLPAGTPRRNKHLCISVQSVGAKKSPRSAGDKNGIADAIFCEITLPAGTPRRNKHLCKSVHSVGTKNSAGSAGEKPAGDNLLSEAQQVKKSLGKWK